MDPELLAQLLSAQSPQLSPQLLAAAGGGLGRTDLQALLGNTGLGLGTGAVDPFALEQSMMNFYGSQLSEVEAERERLRRDREAEERSIMARYITVEPPEVNLDTVTPLWSSEISQNPVLRDTFVELERGASVDDAIAATGVFDLYGGDDAQWARLESALGQFSREKQIRDSAQLRYNRDLEENQARAAAEIAALPAIGEVADPDLAASRREFYSDAGLPLLGLLPSPSETYQIPAGAMLERSRRDRPSGLTLAEELLLETTRPSGRTPAATLPSGQTTRMLNPVSGKIPNPLAATQVSMRGADQSYRDAAQLPAGQFVTNPRPASQSPRSLALEMALAPNMMTREQRIQQAVMRERENAQLGAEAVGRGLARAGRTPYEDAMRVLLAGGSRLEASA